MTPTELLLLGWSLPLLLGVGLWLLLTGLPRGAAAWLGALGYGYVCGLISCAGIVALSQARHTDEALLRLWPWLTGASILLWFGAWLLRRVGIVDAQPATKFSGPFWLRGFCALLFILLVSRAWLLFGEVSLLQTFPWDAWGAWAVKPKTWYLLGHSVSFASMGEWLASGDADIHTNVAWNYPQLLAWVEIWCANAANGWNEPLINFAWWGLWVALLFACYGQLRSLGLNAQRALITVYVLGSLPLLETHVALAGYADIWLATVFMLAVLSWLRWLYLREPRQLLAALLLSLLLPQLKLEGAIWVLCLWSVIAFGFLPRRWGWGIVLTLGCVSGIALLLGGLSLPVPGLGPVKFTWDSIDVPGKGSYSLQWHSVGPELSRSLFTLSNWHLLWFIFPLALVWRWRVLLADSGLRALAALLLLCGLFLFVLFFFTDAGQWAKDFTSANRLTLHVAPLAVIFIALLLRDAEPQNETPLRDISPAHAALE